MYTHLVGGGLGGGFGDIIFIPFTREMGFIIGKTWKRRRRRGRYGGTFIIIAHGIGSLSFSCATLIYSNQYFDSTRKEEVDNNNTHTKTADNKA